MEVGINDPYPDRRLSEYVLPGRNRSENISLVFGGISDSYLWLYITVLVNTSSSSIHNFGLNIIYLLYILSLFFCYDLHKVLLYFFKSFG